MEKERVRLRLVIGRLFISVHPFSPFHRPPPIINDARFRAEKERKKKKKQGKGRIQAGEVELER